MSRLHSLTSRHRRLTVLLWVLLLLAAIPLASRQSAHLTNGGYVVPGSASRQVDQALSRFDSTASEPLAIVVDRAGASAAEARTALERAVAAARNTEGVTVDRHAVDAALAAGGPVAIVPLKVPGDQDIAADAATALSKALADGSSTAGARTHLVGQQALWAAMRDVSKQDLTLAESVGFPILLLLLVLVFGSFMTAALPIVLALVAVSVTGGLVYGLAHVTDMSIFVTNVASMIGIGVSVDYSLFVLARYRQELRRGHDPSEALAVTMRTSGHAVVISGLTVIVSLSALLTVNVTMIRSLAVGAIVVVAVSVAGAVTLVPVLIALLGKRIGAAPQRGRFARLLPTPRAGFWERWTERVMRRPGVTIAVSVTALLALAAPALSLAINDGPLEQLPKDNATRQGTELAARAVGAGAGTPIQVLATFRGKPSAAATAAVERFTMRLRSDPRVASVSTPERSRDGGALLVNVVSRHEAEHASSIALVDSLRARAPRALAGVADVKVGGATALDQDFKDKVIDSLWTSLALILVLCYIVLAIALRSLVLPVKAVLMNLLTVGAAYGVLVMVFQWGWFDGLFGFQSLGFVHAMTLPLLLAVVFGLSMDYEVFLLARIREGWIETGDNRQAVAHGLSQSAGTISAAALIMIVVFATFAGVGVPSIKELGVGLAVAIALDATLVRLMLVPATMQVLGRWNWWLPKRRSRAAPRSLERVGV